MNDTNIKKIAELNDLCRTAMGVAGRLFQTIGIDALPLADQSAIRERHYLPFRQACDNRVYRVLISAEGAGER